MPLSELAYRGWQEASKWIERVAPGQQVDPLALLSVQAPELASAEAAVRMLRDRAATRFFAGLADDSVASALAARLPQVGVDIIADANALVEGRFNLLGYSLLWFGDPIDWHLDPVWSRRAPMDHWSAVDPLDPATVGDSKIVWELNRHQWLARLGQAWALTGDDRYARAAVETIDNWLEANPPGLGVNWTSSLEVGYRLMSWCWMATFLRHSPLVTGEWLLKLLAAIWFHATHIRRFLSYYFSPNTHLTGEALALVYAGTLFPEFRDAARWRELGSRILVSESHAQLTADSVHFEQSTCYHRYTVETYLQFLLLAARNGLAIPPSLGDRVARMVEFLVAIRRPDGSIPFIGDGDGGALLQLVERPSGDASGVFAVAAALFGRPDFAWAAGSPPPELYWLMGLDAVRSLESMPAAPPSEAASGVFPSGGYAIMRSGWDREAHQLIVDVGPLGCPISSGHGHADLLSVQCSVFGEPVLVDAGTYCYTAEAPWRNFFRGTAAHSTVIVDSQPQATPAGPFGWHEHPRARLGKWHSDATFDFLEASHDAYLSLPDPVRIRRRVIFVKPHYWIVVDDLGGRSSHVVDLTFQFAPLEVTLGPHPWARARTPRGRALWLASFPAGPVRAAIKCGELSPIRGWISTDYGQRQPAPMLIYSSDVMLPWRMITLLLPDPQAAAAPPPVHPIYDDTGLPTGLTFERPRRSVRFDDHAVLVTSE
jgi:hypothetical protein